MTDFIITDWSKILPGTRVKCVDRHCSEGTEIGKAYEFERSVGGGCLQLKGFNGDFEEDCFTLPPIEPDQIIKSGDKVMRLVDEFGKGRIVTIERVQDNGFLQVCGVPFVWNREGFALLGPRHEEEDPQREHNKNLWEMMDKIAESDNDLFETTTITSIKRQVFRDSANHPRTDILGSKDNLLHVLYDGKAPVQYSADGCRDWAAKLTQYADFLDEQKKG